jgi:SAM-dependent methyltransferase
MNISRLIEFLETEENQKFFSDLQSREELSINEIQKLENEYNEYPIKDILSLIKIQKKNLKKNPDSLNLIYTEKGAQQASSKRLAIFHADKFEKHSIIADLCCGNGIDLMHLAAGKKKVFAVDLDEKTLNTAKYNLSESNNIEFIQGKAEDFDKSVDAVFIDPDRRIDSIRTLRLEDMSPSLSSILHLKSITANIAIKLSPATDYRSLNIEDAHTFEFISEEGVLKEILLCFGDFATKNVTRKAILLPVGIYLSNNDSSIPVVGIHEFIFEPDPAVIRAGLVQELGAEIGFSLIDKHLALLTGKNAVFSNFGTTYKTVTSFSYDIKMLHKYCRQEQIGELVIKTRGFPIPVEKFRNKLKLKGKQKAVLFIIRLGDDHEMIIAEIALQ